MTIERLRGNPVGASLLAIVECQSTSVLAVTPQSRAGSLPQGIGGVVARGRLTRPLTVQA
ncbi:hypothetical protein FGE05_20200 [Pseudomonas sp. ICMP22404]|nr:hypothetical protein FGE05_20200 [Pseudomonas sp. ICMP22404]